MSRSKFGLFVRVGWVMGKITSFLKYKTCLSIYSKINALLFWNRDSFCFAEQMFKVKVFVQLFVSSQ